MRAREPVPARLRTEHVIGTRSVGLGCWLYRVTRGRAPRLWHRRALLLTTTGRRTGAARTVIVQFFPDGEDVVVVAANSGLPAPPGWYVNLTAHPEAVVEVEGRTLRVRAAEMSARDVAAFWPRVLETAPDHARYRERTSRAIPLLRLTPFHEQRP